MSADDLLNEPFTGGTGTGTKTASGGILRSGISTKPEGTIVEIMRSNPRQLYTDAATDVMNHASQIFKQMHDVRKPSLFPVGVKMPAGALDLNMLVGKFHDGLSHFWVSCPGLTVPREFEFTGRFGHVKVLRFAYWVGVGPSAQKTQPFIGAWFWVDTTEGQMQSVELGILVLHPTMRLHHVFDNKVHAEDYYNS